MVDDEGAFELVEREKSGKLLLHFYEYGAVTSVHIRSTGSVWELLMAEARGS